VDAVIARLTKDLDDLATKDFVRAEVRGERQRVIMWMVSTQIAVLGVLVALLLAMH
jgi:hypothetical protein